MTPEEIERQAKVAGVSAGEYLKSLNDAPKIEEKAVVEEPKPALPKMQYVIVVMADGRRGVFAGPELVTRAEMTLNCVPRLVSVDFSMPKEVAEPKPLGEVIQEANSDPKADAKPGLV